MKNVVRTEIRKFVFLLAVFAATLISAYNTPATALVIKYHSWVSLSGLDSNACTDSSPCLSFQQAIDGTRPGGEVSCLGSGNFGTFTVTQAITIDCKGTLASPAGDQTFSCTGGLIVINAPGQIVTLRNLTISGYASAAICSGIAIEAAAAVNIEDCVLGEFTNSAYSAISVTTSANTVINIRNSSIRSSVNGISFAPTGGAVNGSIDHTMIAKMSADGITATGAAYVTVTNSVISNAAGVGISAGASAVLEVASSSVSNNKTAFGTTGGIIRISHNEIYDNTANFSISGGTIATAGNNDVAVSGSTVPNATITQQ